MNDVQIGVVEKSSIDQIRVAIRFFENKRYIDVRTFTKDDRGQFVPTKKGITLQPDTLMELVPLLYQADARYGGVTFTPAQQSIPE